MDRFPFETTANCPRADQYELTEEGFIFPVEGLHADETFPRYQPFDHFVSGDAQPESAPHTHLLSIDPTDPEEVLGFVNKWGLLGTARRWEFQDGDPAALSNWIIAHSRVVKEEPLEQLKAGKDVGGIPGEDTDRHLIPGEFYFKDCIRERTTQVGPLNFWHHYGEKLDQSLAEEAGVIRRGLNDEDTRKVVDVFTGIFSWNQHDSFTYAALKFQAASQVEAFLQEEFRRNTGMGIGTREDKIAFDYGSLLDACYLMLFLDSLEGKLHQCPECHRYWRATEEIREGQTFCPKPPEDRGCAQRASERKTRQRKSWARHLNKTVDLTLLNQLPTTRNKNFKHPYDLDLPSQKPEIQRAALTWVEKVQSRPRSRDYDCWLNPVRLELEELLDH